MSGFGLKTEAVILRILFESHLRSMNRFWFFLRGAGHIISRCKSTGAGANRVKYDLNHRSKSENYREFEGREGVKLPEMRVPSSWQKFNTDTSGLHPTVKPVPLFEYLINTYTKEGELVLDNCAGSGTTGIACKNTKRHYVMIEQEQKYYNAILKRLDSVEVEKSDTIPAISMSLFD